MRCHASLGAPGGEPWTFVPREMPPDRGVAVDRGIRRRTRPEHLVAERVVEVGVRVHQRDEGPVEPCAHVGEDLLALGGLGARVDDEQAVVALDDDHGEVERSPATLVHAAGDPGPGGHARSLRVASMVGSEGIQRFAS